ncbi:MAG: type II toxin-antitoxin system VapC family toxin [Vicinamibacterales bacterium]
MLDTSVLTLFLKPDIVPPNDPATGRPITHATARIEHAIKTLSAKGARIVVPATVLAEFLVCADETAVQDYIDALHNKAGIEVVPFDSISAIEAAHDQRRALMDGNKQETFSSPRQCLKADRQIVAVAKTRRVDAIISTDDDIRKICETMGVKFIGVWDLEIPESDTPLLDAAEANLDDVETGETTAPSPSPTALDSGSPAPE